MIVISILIIVWMTYGAINVVITFFKLDPVFAILCLTAAILYTLYVILNGWAEYRLNAREKGKHILKKIAITSCGNVEADKDILNYPNARARIEGGEEIDVELTIFEEYCETCEDITNLVSIESEDEHIVFCYECEEEYMKWTSNLQCLF